MGLQSLPFTVGEAEAQRSSVTYLRPHNCWAVGQDVNLCGVPRACACSQSQQEGGVVRLAAGCSPLCLGGLTSPGCPAGRRFRLDTRLRRIRRKDWRRDFFRDFTRDSGPSKASWSLGCSVHLGGTAGRQRCQGLRVFTWHQSQTQAPATMGSLLT